MSRSVVWWLLVEWWWLPMVAVSVWYWLTVGSWMVSESSDVYSIPRRFPGRAVESHPGPSAQTHPAFRAVVSAPGLTGSGQHRGQAVLAGECEGCGCSDFAACTDAAGLPCWWVSEDPRLCSVCAAEIEATKRLPEVVL